MPQILRKIPFKYIKNYMVTTNPIQGLVVTYIAVVLNSCADGKESKWSLRKTKKETKHVCYQYMCDTLNQVTQFLHQYFNN